MLVEQNKEVKTVHSGCLGSKIKVYSLWAVEQCDDLRDEIEYLVNLILDDAPTRKEEMLSVLEEYKNHDDEKERVKEKEYYLKRGNTSGTID